MSNAINLSLDAVPPPFALEVAPKHTPEHFVQFYRSSIYLAHSVAEYLRQGLVTSEGLLLVATDEHWALVSEILTEQHFDLSSLIEEGRLIRIDAAPTLESVMKDGQPDYSRFLTTVSVALRTLFKKTTRVRCYEELVNLLSQAGQSEEAHILEGYWNELLGTLPGVTLMCGYRIEADSEKSEAELQKQTGFAHQDFIKSEKFGVADLESLKAAAVLEQRALNLRMVVRDQRRLESELSASQSALAQASKLSVMGELCASVAHDINNPLAVVSGYTAIIFGLLESAKSESTPSPDLQEIEEKLKRIENATEQMIKIVRNVLDFSRPGLNRKKPITIAEVLDASHLLMGDLLSKSRITVTSEIEKDAEKIQILGDKTSLMQAFVNILMNSRDAILDKQISERREIKISYRSLNDEEMELRIADCGTGMGSELVARIFEAFFTTKGAGQGTGLGLSIAAGVVREHGGRIQCHSQLGQGTEFQIILPKFRG